MNGAPRSGVWGEGSIASSTGPTFTPPWLRQALQEQTLPSCPPPSPVPFPIQFRPSLPSTYTDLVPFHPMRTCPQHHSAQDPAARGSAGASFLAFCPSPLHGPGLSHVAKSCPFRPIVMTLLSVLSTWETSSLSSELSKGVTSGSEGPTPAAACSAHTSQNTYREVLML